MSEGKTFRAALVQLCAGRHVADNVETATSLIREAAARGADYVLTPENTTLMELDRAALLAHTPSWENHQSLRHFQALADELAIWLHLGSVGVKLAADKLANRSCLIAPDGALAAHYDKIHMFDVDLPGGESYRESHNFRPGNRAELTALPWGRLGMSICYDLRFPQLYRRLAQAGAEILTVPAAFTRQTGEAHWHVLLRARAIENGCFVLAAAQGGRHETGRETFGHSLIVDPWGRILAEADTQPGVVIANIDIDEVARARARIPSLSHDRPFTAPPSS